MHLSKAAARGVLCKKVFLKISQNLQENTPSKHINVESTLKRTLIFNVHQRCFNVDIWLKMKVEPTYIYQRCFNVGKTTLKQRRLNYVDST